MNLQISGYQTAMISVHFITKSGVASLPEKAQDMNDFSRHLTDVWFGVEHSITDDGIYQW